MRRCVIAALMLVSMIAALASPAFADPGNGNGNGPRPHPTCPPNSQNPGGQPPCGNGNGGGTPSPSPTPSGYPPTPIITIGCLQLFGDVTTGNTPQVKLGGHVTLLSPPGCLVGGQLLVVVVLSEPHVLGQTKVLEDGSARIDATMPAQLPVGTHNLEVDLGGQTHAVRAIDVVPRLDNVSPVSSRSTPASGTSAAMLALWALLIIGGGAVLASFGWRRRRAQHAVAGGAAPRATEIPRIDTSGFTPVKRDPRSEEGTED
jgi:hypothetical protein